MLNNPSAIPDLLTNKWVAYCLMFDFELQHVSRENIMLADIMTCLHEVCDISPDTNTASVIEDTLEKGTYQVGQLYIHVPNPSITIKQMKDKLTKLLGEDYTGKDHILKLVIDNEKTHQILLSKAHKELGHFGGKQLYLYVKRQFYWDQLKRDAKETIRTCDLCQKYAKNVSMAPMFLQPVLGIMEELAMDHLLIDGHAKNKYLIVI
ncbi:hypothetical protein HMI54_007678 [Coelomomyces lativittatus]|nr:hypothetical protein HMI56_003645 [Coelomomyces lativittatus]KAJ1503869.1 hypothetical protein HMI54_007678 [Coelomomyces lativittatus]